MVNHTLNCAVVGAGIAGLATCIALRKAGHNVEVLEKSRFKNEIGAAISITPNGNKVLDSWGFDFDKARETDKQLNRRVKPDTLEEVAYNTFDDIPKRFGHRFNAFHRVDLHSTLRELAESTELPGKLTLRLGTDVLDVDCETGTLTLGDGSKVKKDLIVIADGIKSRFIEAVNGVDIPRIFTAMSVHRALIKIDTLMENDLLRPIFEGHRSGFYNTVSPSGIMIVTYPCRRDEWMNVAIFHRARPTEKVDDDWNAPADIEDVLSLLQDGFHPAWSALVNCAGQEEWKCFPVSKRDPLDRITKGKVVIIGDAAHACLPTHAQGASMALEDAAALQVLFSSVRSLDDIPKLLHIYQQLRLPRSATTQLLSNAMMYHQGGDDAVTRVRQYYSGVLPVGAESASEPIQNFFYAYDVFAESEKALKHVDDPEGVPNGTLNYFGYIPASV